MNEHKREQLSAFMDGEQEQGAINDLLTDNTIRQTWARFHLIRDVMRQTLPQQSCINIAARVSAHIDNNEPALLAPMHRRSNHYLKPVAGLAIAASVAAVAVFGIQQHNLQNIDNSPKLAAIEPINLASLPKARQYTIPVRQVSLNQIELGPEKRTLANARLNTYLINYNEYHARTGVQGMLPYVRIVSSDTSE